MADDEIALTMTWPIDQDGFLRRECPTCEREFKWRTAQDDGDGLEKSREGYYCPYCAIAAPPDSWWTPAQLEFARTIALREVLGPELKKLRGTARRANNGLVEVSIDAAIPGLPAENAEDDGMTRFDFPCHDEPVKVLDGWARPVYCLICGDATP